MSDEVPIATQPISPDEASAFARLSAEEIKGIDEAVLSCILPQWRKLAMIVTRVEDKLKAQYPQFSRGFYAERIRFLADSGMIESQGNLSYMRFSEVRLFQKE